jgi:hypothetical protein
MRRRDFIALLGGITAISPRAVRAQQGDQRLIPLLIDLPGWTGNAPIESGEEKKGGQVIALRIYVRGEARLNAVLGSGVPARPGGNDSPNYTTPEEHVRTSTISGFQVTSAVAPDFVWISVKFSPVARFNLYFHNVAEDEAMAIAQKFDWRQIQALLPN